MSDADPHDPHTSGLGMAGDGLPHGGEDGDRTPSLGISLDGDDSASPALTEHNIEKLALASCKMWQLTYMYAKQRALFAGTEHLRKARKRRGVSKWLVESQIRRRLRDHISQVQGQRLAHARDPRIAAFERIVK